MKIALIIAETPYLNEWFAACIQQTAMQHPPPEWVLYCNSPLAKKDKLPLFPENLPVYHYRSFPELPLPEQLDWRDAYISWERQDHFNAVSYTSENIPQIARDIWFSLSAMLEAEKPDWLLYELPSSILGDIAWKICQTNLNTRFIAISQSRIPDRLDIYDNKYTFLSKPAVKPLPTIDWVRFNDDFVHRRILPTYMKDGINSMHKTSVFGHYIARLHRLRFFLRHLPLLFKKDNYESIEAYRQLPVALKNHIARKLRAKWTRHLYQMPKKDEVYALFPLHLLPESSVSGQASYFSEIISTVRYIAFSLPMSWRLYVREHPGAVGTRNKNFFKTLKKIPNVRLISADADGVALTAASSCVITLTSTLGMEAALRGKKVFVLGDVFYENHPNCIKIRHIEDLTQELRQLEKAAPNTEKELHTANTTFWKTYYANTISGDVLTPVAQLTELLEHLKLLEKLSSPKHSPKP